MITKLIVPALIAALLWGGYATIAQVPEKPAGNIVAAASTEAPAEITDQDAKTIALNHAGFTAEQVTGLRAYVDYDDGRKEFEVEFRNNDWEYDYTILASNGTILHSEKEYDPPKVKETVPAESAPVETQPAQVIIEETKPAEAAAPAEITADEAKAIALKHAGFTAEQVTGLRAEVDYDDGRKEFEVEFRNNDWEYDYTILASDGSILRNEKEYDPPKQKTSAPAETKPKETTPAKTSQLTKEEAKAIAFQHAGVKESQVKGLKVKLDRDDGVSVYEIEFYVNQYEYEYEIHAESGKIREWDKDVDD